MNYSQADVRDKKSVVLAIRFVTFVYYNNEVKTLLVKADDAVKWHYPHEVIKGDENIQEAAQRIIFEHTNLKDSFCQQIGVSESPLDFRTLSSVADWPEGNVVVFINYYVLQRWDFRVINKMNKNYRWFALDRQPPVVSADKTLLESAKAVLIRGLSHHPVGYYLLSKRFTIPDLQNLYEQILERKLNKGNFYRKILSYSILKNLNEVQKGPDVYQFNKENYLQALETGLILGF